MDRSEFERMCHNTDTSSTSSEVSCRKRPFFFKLTAFQLLPRAHNKQKSYYGPCKINERASGSRFQRFYYEKTLVGNTLPHPQAPELPSQGQVEQGELQQDVGGVQQVAHVEPGGRWQVSLRTIVHVLHVVIFDALQYQAA